jgi:HAD superfamily hydrolase (TIGR01549 family)
MVADMPIDTLFLDAGGVLVFPNWDRVHEVLATHGIHVTADELRRGEPAAKFRVDQGDEITRADDANRGSTYFRLVLANAGVADTPAVTAALNELYAYHNEHNLWEHVPGDVRPALERLSAGRRLVIVSNANGTVARMFGRVKLGRYFHTICDSCVEGVEKPDPRFFKIALDRSGADPQTTLHVGDLYHIDVVGARNAGLQAMLLDPHDLYSRFDADRVRTLDELADRLG